MLLWVIGLVMVLAGVILFLHVVIINKKVDATGRAFWIYILLFVFGIMFTFAGVLTECNAKFTYNNLLERKIYIEANYQSEDRMTQWKVGHEYFKYVAEYEQVLQCHKDGIFGGYYNLDIDKLKLNIDNI